jgi:hypothetical protein
MRVDAGKRIVTGLNTDLGFVSVDKVVDAAGMVCTTINTYSSFVQIHGSLAIECDQTINVRTPVHPVYYRFLVMKPMLDLGSDFDKDLCMLSQYSPNSSTNHIVIHDCNDSVYMCHLPSGSLAVGGFIRAAMEPVQYEHPDFNPKALPDDFDKFCEYCIVQ